MQFFITTFFYFFHCHRSLKSFFHIHRHINNLNGLLVFQCGGYYRFGHVILSYVCLHSQTTIFINCLQAYGKANSNVLHEILKIQQKMRRHRSLRVMVSRGRRSGRYFPQSAVEISLLIFCYIFYIAYKSLWITKPCMNYKTILSLDSYCSWILYVPAV